MNHNKASSREIRVVLVETTHPGNIGAAARAMSNMGLTSLVLVNPREHPVDKARWRAASAVDVVDGARVVETVDEAIAGCELVVGTSARDRRIPWPMLDPRECGAKIATEASHNVAILFGRESRGLKNEELQKCHYHVNIPTAEAYSSLNLAMAVQVITYEILMAAREAPPPLEWDQPIAGADSVEHFYEHLERTLTDIGFHDPDNPRQLLPRLRRLFNRVRMDQMEVNMLRGILTTVDTARSSSREDGT
ncbi:MAG: tRNA (cytosine(32)/uridine(32)-2'-O)-methyltransferase TrmJ [Gammaproteobacteria bacterium]|nr:tRNA (cytosine(32)/uridine(32)-2'-O)-methyltransferase TrmJ [Gammaproteobacteria bacterium]|tara:strand:- start:123 stop:872 length:750 start_codon:yes stop_codon:yes gene_type:complete